MKFIVEGYRTDQEKPVYRATAKGFIDLTNKLLAAFTHSKAHYVTVRLVKEVRK